MSKHISGLELTREMIDIVKEKTGSGSLDARRALESHENNIDEAIEYLNEKLSKGIGPKIL